MKQSLIFGGVAAIVSGVIGGAAGYFVAKRRLTAEFEARITKEIEETKRFYSTIHKTKPEYATPEAAAAALGADEVVLVESATALITPATEAMVSYSGVPPQSRDMNVFVRDEAEVPSAEELRARTEEAPYVITKMEYEANETEYTQTELSWYEGDKILADERDQTVDDVDMTIGLNNLEKFGHRSKDPRVVYIRNDAMELDFCVLKIDGKYGELVAGFGT